MRNGNGSKQQAATVSKAGKTEVEAFPRLGSGLRITTKGRYGLRVMVELARHTGPAAVALRDLAQRLTISEKYLWHIARLLTSAGLIRAVRGAHGGYRLAQPVETITLQDIIEALEGPCQLVPAAEHEDGAAGLIWRELERALVAHLHALTLRGALEQYDAQTAAPNYSI
ncbi:MAG: Rrf2 family transcriptional regulator [Verrucomicrobia bacterium]|nr:MAG: Rrf2 family transcriptional regulator [Verrucomicrobiota bacterium]